MLEYAKKIVIEEESKERESLAFIYLFLSPVLLSCSADPLMLNPCCKEVDAASSVSIIMQSRCSVTPKYLSSARTSPLDQVRGY